MLKNPKYGWCDVEVGDFKGVASYLTDVPFNCLAAFIQYFNRKSNTNSSSIYFDEEGTEFTVVIEYYCTYVITDRNEIPELKYFNGIGAKQLAIELIEDLERDFDKWVNWETLDDFEPSKNRTENLRSGIEELKQLTKDFR